MEQMHTFVRTEPWPSYFANALQKAMAVLADNLVITQTDATHISIVAGANDAAVSVAVMGLWRWMESTVGPIAHPGGAAGAYPVFVTAKAQNISSTPLPFTDNTDYSFAMQIKAPGATPTIVAGTVDVYRQIGVLQWDGSKIIRVDQTVPATPRHRASHLAAGGDSLAPNVRTSPGSGGTITAADGDMISVLAGDTCLMPVGAPAGAVVRVFAYGVPATNPAVISATPGFGAFYGRGLNAAPSFNLAGGTTSAVSVTLISFASGLWLLYGDQDTGWVPLTLASGILASSGYTPAVRVKGDMGMLRGGITNLTGGTVGIGATIATLPGGVGTPSQAVPLEATSTSIPTFQVTAGGVLTPTLSAVNGTNWNLNGKFYSLRT